MSIVCLIAGAVCILYFLSVLLTSGAGSNFYIVGILTGLVLLALGLELRFHVIFRRLPVWFLLLMKIGITVGVVVFIFVEGCILSYFGAKGEPGLDYVIILGAQVRESGPSRSLQMRLDCAYEYLLENKETRVIVSGGQGDDEPISEAECMAEYLENLGIQADRIMREDKSTNTSENLRFSRQLVEGEPKVGVVTNKFHVFRATHIARKSGFQDASPIAAETYLPSLPSDMLREFFGIMKDFLCGNM